MHLGNKPTEGETETDSMEKKKEKTRDARRVNVGSRTQWNI